LADCGTPEDEPAADTAVEEDDAPSVLAVCPWNACAASSENIPAAATAPAISQRLIRRISSRPASRAMSARGTDLPRVGRESWCGTEVGFIAQDSSRHVEAIAKESVSRL
jgi:hypothetical protein